MTGSLEKFIENAIAWLARKKEKIKVGSHFKFSHQKYKESKELPPKDLGSDRDVDVYIVNGEQQFSTDDVKAIVDFVEKGGGLMIGGQAWYFDKPIVEFSANKYAIENLKLSYRLKDGGLIQNTLFSS